jgi:hypothetical protein
LKTTPLIAVTDIEDIEAVDSEIVIRPNPTVGELYVKTHGVRLQNIEIFDIFGRNVNSKFKIQNSKFDVDISHLPTGIYFLRITTENGIVSRKIIKQ